MQLRMKLYQFLVNRHAGIAARYHNMHDNASGMRKVFSWVYLLWLNFAYYFLFMHFLGDVPDMEIYETKEPPTVYSESEAGKKDAALFVDGFVSALKKYDVVSFDVFDTLLFRPFDDPTALFYTVGEKLGFMNFKQIRICAEADARKVRLQKYGDTEVTLAEIWERLERETGLSAETGQQIEQMMESTLCYANPFMLAVWKRLREIGKKIVITSDMYLPVSWFETVLPQNGFSGMEKIFLSNDYRKSKASGALFQILKREYPNQKIVHIGDNPHSDGKMAKKASLHTLPYPSASRNNASYRPYDMSPLIGSAYRGSVGNFLYSGLRAYSMEYEYGFIYGGLFVFGYCHFIHEYCRCENVDRILFLARDGDIIKKVYDRLFPDDDTEYVLWSRKAAVKLMASYDRHDYFRRFLYHKTDQNYTIREILRAMELEDMFPELSDVTGLSADEKLTDQNVHKLRVFFEERWERVLFRYEEQQTAAELYYRKKLEGCTRAVAVDIGWAGSGAVSLSCLASKKWHIPCYITGIVAGTNTPHNAEPDAMEPFLQSGRLTAYLYASDFNRDLYKWHNPNRGDNVFWELLLASPNPPFQGFYADGLQFGENDMYQEKALEIQKGILDFATEYEARFSKVPYMFRISGRDAYAPMLAASGNRRDYLNKMASKFSLSVNVE